MQVTTLGDQAVASAMNLDGAVAKIEAGERRRRGICRHRR